MKTSLGTSIKEKQASERKEELTPRKWGSAGQYKRIGNPAGTISEMYRISDCVPYLFLVIIFFVLCNSVRAASPQDDQAVWRKGKVPLSHADIEHLARDVGYQGGRFQPNEGSGGTARNADALAIRGDKAFRENLSKNGLKLLDSIDNTSTGLQAVLIQDTSGNGRVYTIFRGTEFSEGVNNERWKDTYADMGRIGNNQYSGADKGKLDKWAAQYGGNMTVTGHSLGGALAQRFIVDHPEAVNEAVLFNSPGLDKETAARLAKEKIPPITYYLHPRDPVSQHGGDVHLPGKVFMAEGGISDSNTADAQMLAEHRAYLLSGDSRIKVKEKNFNQWQNERRPLLEISSAVNVLDRAMQTDKERAKDFVASRQAAYANALQRGEIRLRPGVTGKDLIAIINAQGPNAGSLDHLVERTPGKAERVKALKCSEGSEAYWDDTANKALCRCIKGYAWDDVMKVCVVTRETLVASMKCQPNSEAYWNDESQSVRCKCRKGYMLNDSKTECVIDKAAQVRLADCSRTPNSRPYWDEKEGKAMCKSCLEGYRWKDKTGFECIVDKEAQIKVADCSKTPNSRPYWDEKANKAMCKFCLPGFQWKDKSGLDCIADKEAQIKLADCSKTPNSRPYWDEKTQTVRCQYCLTGSKWKDKTGLECVADKKARAEMLAAADCTMYTEAVPFWDERTNGPSCNCADGYHWEGDRCVRDGRNRGNELGQVLIGIADAVRQSEERQQRNTVNNSGLARPETPASRANRDHEECVRCVNSLLGGSCYARIPTLAGWGLCISCTKDGAVEPENRFIDKNKCPICSKTSWKLQDFKRYGP